MPRAIDASTLNVGTGLAAEDSIEANALVHPTGGNDGLRVHILDPSRAHEARAIHLEDVGGFYFSDDVEGALQELGGAGSSSRVNGVIEGGTYTAVGLTVTLATPTTVRVNGLDADFSGDSIALLDNQTQYLYVDGSTGVLTRSTSLPALSTESILLAQITTVAGAITASTDLRFFVFNLDRKLPITVRSEGTDFDQRSEAAFVSLDAAFLYLNLYGGGSGSNPVETQRLLIRGQIAIGGTAVPVDNLILEGDGTGSFVTNASGNALVLTGRSHITVRNLLFTCDHTSSTAIHAAATSTCDHITVEDCQFEDGAETWDNAVHIETAGSASTGHVIRNCRGTVLLSGIKIERGDLVRITDTKMYGDSAATSSYGIRVVNTNVPEGNNLIRGCYTENFSTGIDIGGIRATVTDCNMTGVATGLSVDGSALESTIRNVNVSNDANEGLVGITLGTNCHETKITGCRLNNARTVWSGVALTVGLQLNGADDITVTDTTIDNYRNTFDDTGYGVLFLGANPRVAFDNVTIDDGEYGIYSPNSGAGAADKKFSNLHITGVKVGIFSGSPGTQINTSTVELDGARGITGIDLDSGDNQRVRGTSVHNPRSSGSYGADTPVGILIRNGAENISLEDCSVTGFFSTSSASSAIHSDATSSYTRILGGIVQDSAVGAFLQGEYASVVGLTCRDTAAGVNTTNNNATVRNCSGSLDSTYGTVGVSCLGIHSHISGCHFTLARTVWAGQMPAGFVVQGDHSSVEDCSATGFYNATDDLGTGVYFGTNPDNVLIKGVTVDEAVIGIDAERCGHNTVVEGCTLSQVSIGAVFDDNHNNISISDCTITLDLARGTDGIVMTGGGSGINAKVLGNTITNERTSWGAPDPTPRAIEAGIAGLYSDNIITGFRNTFSSTGSGIVITDNRIKVRGNTVEGPYYGIHTSDDTFASCEISGNLLLGDQVMVDGIRVVNHTSTTRSRNWIIKGNTVNACVNYGINISGLVRDTTVEGNTIDGYLVSAAPDPTMVGIKVWNETGTGAYIPEWISVSDNTVERCAVGIWAAGDDESDVLENIKISDNHVHHCGQAQAAPSLETETDTSPGIRVSFGRHIQVTDNKVTDSGRIVSNSTGWGIPSAGGSFIVPVGIHIYSSEKLLVSGNTVNDLHELGVAAVGIGILFAHANLGTAVSLYGLDFLGNTVYGGGGDWMGIYVLVTDGTVVGTHTHRVFEATISDNGIGTFLAPPATGIKVLAAISGSGTEAEASTIKFSGNRVFASTLGIAVEAGADGVVEDVSFVDNTVTLGDNGKAISAVASLTHNGFGNILIEANKINGKNATLTYGVFVNNINPGTSTQGVVINDNHIRQTTAYGIFYAGQNANTTTISANEIVLYSGDAIRFITPSYDRLTIVDNVCQGVNDSAANFGIGITTSVANAHDRLNISGNTFEQFAVAAIHVDMSTGGGMKASNINNNIIRSSGASSQGIHLEFPTLATSTPTPAIDNVEILNNNIEEVGLTGIHVELDAATSGSHDLAENLRVCGNLFNGVAQDGAQDAGSFGEAGIKVTLEGGARGIAVCDNVFVDCCRVGVSGPVTHTLTLNLSGDADNYESIDVSRNQFRGDRGGSIEITFTDEDAGGTATANEAARINIDDNLTGSYNGATLSLGYGIFVDFAVMDNVEFFSLRGNMIEGSAGVGLVTPLINKGIFIEASDMVSDTTDEGFNEFDLSGNKVAYTTEEGIRVDASHSGTPTIQTVQRFDVCNNVVFDTGEDGIHIDMHDVEGRIEGVRVSRNHVSNATDHGIYFGEAETQGALTMNVQMSENIVRECGGMGVVFDGFRTKIEVSALVTVDGTEFACYGVQMCGNSISGCGDHGIRFRHEPDDNVGIDGLDANHINLSGNYLYNNGTNNGTTRANDGQHGMSIRVSGGATLVAPHVTNNQHIGNAGFGFFIDTGVALQNEEPDPPSPIPKYPLYLNNAGDCTNPLFLGNTARDNNSGNNDLDVGMEGTKFPPTLGRQIANNDEGNTAGVPTLGRWRDIVLTTWLGGTTTTLIAGRGSTEG